MTPDAEWDLTTDDHVRNLRWTIRAQQAAILRTVLAAGIVAVSVLLLVGAHWTLVLVVVVGFGVLIAQRWGIPRRIVRASPQDGLTLLELGSTLGLPVPHAAFATDAEREDFFAWVGARVQRGRTHPDAVANPFAHGTA